MKFITDKDRYVKIQFSNRMERARGVPGGVQPAPAAATSAPTGTASQQPTATVALVAAEVVAPQPVNECLDCHTDQQRLIDTAKPEEEPQESESSGVG